MGLADADQRAIVNRDRLGDHTDTLRCCGAVDRSPLSS